MKVLPTWMWDDPAIVAERMETSELRRAHRQQSQVMDTPASMLGEIPAARPTPAIAARYGLLSPGTVRLIKRARIRELVARVIKGGAR